MAKPLYSVILFLSLLASPALALTSEQVNTTSKQALINKNINGMVNVKYKGALCDNATSDQTAVTNAVSDALAAGEPVYWPDGTCVTTGTIANFHLVQHRGPGIVKRGSDLFYPDPSLHPGATNILYVATTGSDSNDGISSSQPRLTAQETGNLIYNYSYGDITWKIQFAAGTYIASTSFIKGAFPTPNRVQFLGAAVADGTVPTTIFDSPGGASKNGLYFQNYIRVYVEDIKFTDYNDSGTPSLSGNGSGVTIDEHSELYARNLHISNCDTGIQAAANSRLRYQAGIISANAYGMSAIFHSTYTVGYNGSAADITGATGTAILNNTVSGLFIQENSTGHCDYCYIGSNVIGATILVASRLHAVSSTFISNSGSAVRTNFNSNFYDTSSTFTSNAIDVLQQSGSRRAGATGVNETLTYGPGILEMDSLGGSTQSASPVTLYTKDFAANEFAVRNSGFKLFLWGEVVGTANTKTVIITLGATTLLSATIAASTTDYLIDVRCGIRTAASVQKCLTQIMQNGVTPTVAFNNAVAEDLTAAKTLTVTHQVTNTADLNRIGWIELEMVH